VRCIYHLAIIEYHQDEYQKAILLFTQAKELFGEVGDVGGQADCSRGLGGIAFTEKNYDTAERFFHEMKLGYESTGLSLKKIEELVGNDEGWQWFRETHL